MRLLLPHQLDHVSGAVCQHFGITASELHSATRAERTMRPRQIVFYLLNKVYGCGPTSIGHAFEMSR